MVTVERRRYALNRIGHGDYIAWSNDLTDALRAFRDEAIRVRSKPMDPR